MKRSLLHPLFVGTAIMFTAVSFPSESLLAETTSNGDYSVTATTEENGDLTVEGNVDISGNSLSLGTRTDTAEIPGVSLLYLDSTQNPTVSLNATRAGSNWIWQSNSNKPQLKLSESNKLQLYNLASTPAVKITLDPVGISSFFGPVSFQGGISVAGSLINNGTFQTSGSASFGGNLSIAGSVHSSGATFYGAINTYDQNGVANVGQSNNILSGNYGGIAIGSTNTAGGTALGGVHVIACQEGGPSGDYYVEGNATALLNSAFNGFECFGSPYEWSRVITYNENTNSYLLDSPLPEWATALYVFDSQHNYCGSVTLSGANVSSSDCYLIPGDTYVFSTYCDSTYTGLYVGNISFDGVRTKVEIINWGGGGASSSVKILFLSPFGQAVSAIAFGADNTASDNLSQAFGIGNTVVYDLDNSYAGGGGGGAYGRSNYVHAEGAFAFGSWINNGIPYSVQIGPNDEAKITIASSGNLGVGTDTPSVKLEVIGDANIFGTLTVSGAVRLAPQGDILMGEFGNQE